MKLSRVTLDIIKNFAQINQGLILKPGNTLKTINVMKNIFVIAEIPDTIPIEFAIYDLNEFLATHSLMNSPEISFEEDHLLLSEGNLDDIRYFYSNPSVVVSPGDKNIVMPSVAIRFELSNEVFDKIIKSAAVMKLKDLTITPEGIKIHNRNNVGNERVIGIPDMVHHGDNALLKIENLKLIPVPYDVEIANSGISHFISQSEEYPVEYYVALESSDE